MEICDGWHLVDRLPSTEAILNERKLEISAAGVWVIRNNHETRDIQISTNAEKSMNVRLPHGKYFMRLIYVVPYELNITADFDEDIRKYVIAYRVR